ncbi:hypothetical protein D3C86_2162730 [compost metagenome]
MDTEVKLAKHERTEYGERTEQDQSEMTVEQAYPTEQQELRNQDRLARNHVDHKDKNKDHIAAAELDFGEGIGGH